MLDIWNFFWEPLSIHVGMRGGILTHYIFSIFIKKLLKNGNDAVFKMLFPGKVALE